MLIAFAGASGRTDASHAALLVAHAAIAVDGQTTLLMVGGDPAPETGAALRVVRLSEASTDAEIAQAATDCRRDGTPTLVDIPQCRLRSESIQALVDLVVIVVGPHEADEREAAAWATTNRSSRRTAYLGCRRAGGGPAASRFAAAMAKLDTRAYVVACVLPPLGRGEASALATAAPMSRALRAGLLLLAAIRRDMETPPSGGFAPLEGTAADEAQRIAVTGDTRSLPDRLRELADDVESVAAGLGPSADDLAEAPVLDAWEYGIIPVRVLRGCVSGHPDIADGRPARTSEVYLTDRMTWARTLSRWYRLRVPADGAVTGLQ
ncbi:DUF6634 family protein [Methylobacterium pseudosasicola]|uniref:Cellulose biosynthesis protein BcsQ n=1 Tax=Methylobacterium pseudosasicola TaxID=582667 RepID=A0A1I4SM65_9HYPH|nr:DUF6634 family protein [Methylobacterium pseudosasicola]SFM65618.1 hypothetical protein SAMN05192568_104342 [Methylobacterium pseudosasicola]